MSYCSIYLEVSREIPVLNLNYAKKFTSLQHFGYLLHVKLTLYTLFVFINNFCFSSFVLLEHSNKILLSRYYIDNRLSTCLGISRYVEYTQSWPYIFLWHSIYSTVSLLYITVNSLYPILGTYIYKHVKSKDHRL